MRTHRDSSLIFGCTGYERSPMAWQRSMWLKNLAALAAHHAGRPAHLRERDRRASATAARRSPVCKTERGSGVVLAHCHAVECCCGFALESRWQTANVCPVAAESLSQERMSVPAHEAEELERGKDRSSKDRRKRKRSKGPNPLAVKKSSKGHKVIAEGQKPRRRSRRTTDTA